LIRPTEKRCPVCGEPLSQSGERSWLYCAWWHDFFMAL